MRPTWLLLIVRRRAWKASPSGKGTERDPYQLASTMVPSTPADSSAARKPSGWPLAWMTRSASLPAGGSTANARPSARAAVSRAGLTSTTVTAAAGACRQSQAASRPTTPAPITTIRSPGPGRASQTTFTAVSMLAASTARVAGTPSGTGVTAAAGMRYRSWCGCRQNTVRPASPAATAAPTSSTCPTLE